jgi:hypothetical protein
MNALANSILPNKIADDVKLIFNCPRNVSGADRCQSTGNSSAMRSTAVVRITTIFDHVSNGGFGV